MGLISKTIKISLSSYNINYYKSKGYELPLYYNKYRKKMVCKRYSQIEVKVEDLPEKSHNKVLAQCDCCNKEYEIEYRLYIKLINKYNGLLYCHKCCQSLFYSGENSPNWNKNLSNENRKYKRHYQEYNNFVLKVIIRDKRTCQRCGSKQNIKVHHLDGYNWCIDKRTDVTNGITLCNNCHELFHHIYGHKNNTKEQFLEWMNLTSLQLSECNCDIYTINKLLYCFEENKIYKTVQEFYNKYPGIDKANIYKACSLNKSRSAAYGKHFLYVGDILNLTNEEINARWNNSKLQKNIVNFTDNERKYIMNYLEDYNKYYYNTYS